MFWGVLDGRGDPQFVIETVEVRTGPLDSVDPAFAWDEASTTARWRAGWTHTAGSGVRASMIPVVSMCSSSAFAWCAHC
jgi:hypothetical protein